MCNKPYPHGTTLKLENIETNDIGWAHRGSQGELLSACCRPPLDDSQWEIIGEKRPIHEALSLPLDIESVEEAIMAASDRIELIRLIAYVDGQFLAGNCSITDKQWPRISAALVKWKSRSAQP